MKRYFPATLLIAVSVAPAQTPPASWCTPQNACTFSLPQKPGTTLNGIGTFGANTAIPTGATSVTVTLVPDTVTSAYTVALETAPIPASGSPSYTSCATGTLAANPAAPVVLTCTASSTTGGWSYMEVVTSGGSAAGGYHLQFRQCCRAALRAMRDSRAVRPEEIWPEAIQTLRWQRRISRRRCRLTREARQIRLAWPQASMPQRWQLRIPGRGRKRSTAASTWTGRAALAMRPSPLTLSAPSRPPTRRGAAESTEPPATITGPSGPTTDRQTNFASASRQAGRLSETSALRLRRRRPSRLSPPSSTSPGQLRSQPSWFPLAAQ